VTTGFWNERERASVPFRALLLSVLAFSVPLIGATIAPEWAAEDHGLLLWLTPMLPPFLLTYYRGWGGASIGLAAGMAALVTTNLAVLLLGLGEPNYSVILWVVGTYIMICVGAGVMSELLRRERKSAEEMALTDRLTGLPNHRHAAIFLDAAFSAAARGQPVSVVLFSLDRFEQVSERFGEQTGEQVLRRFGAILTEVTRRMDLSARWNGHEFVAILSRCKAGGAAAFADRVLEELRADVFPWGKVTASAGIAEFEAGMGSLELLLAAEDHARFRAIEAGGDGHAIAGTRSEAFADRVSPLNPSAQRGSLRLESDPDRGFQLVPTPRTDEDRRGVSYSQDAPPPRGSETVLVVNDDFAELSAISGALAELGYRVIEAQDGPSALKADLQSPPDLLIVDLIMPGMSGFTVLEQFENRFGPQRVLYLSGNVQSQVSWRGAPGAQVGFASKPLSLRQLGFTVKELLDAPAVPAESVASLV
jgi:diguanylate cyclase (GGDEF)-like protein